MKKYKNNKIVKDYHYWTIHKEEFDNEFWTLDSSVRENIKDNPYCKEARLFEKRLEMLVRERLGLTTV
tara:strand:- start:600 stop:803 length:204 start_codon:yes stop_codon:yes gene_type:complete